MSKSEIFINLLLQFLENQRCCHHFYVWTILSVIIILRIKQICEKWKSFVTRYQFQVYLSINSSNIKFFSLKSICIHEFTIYLVYKNEQLFSSYSCKPLQLFLVSSIFSSYYIKIQWNRFITILVYNGMLYYISLFRFMLTFKSPNLVLKYAPWPNKIKVDCIVWWIWLKLNRKIYTLK